MIGIASYLCQFYNVDETSLRATFPDAIYYLFYLILSLACFFCNKVIVSLSISLGLTLIGVLVRIEFYLPTASTIAGGTSSTAGGNDGLWHSIISSFSGFDGILVANAFIAAAQPFMFSFITTVTDQCLPERWKASYIGLTTATASTGYAFGYLFSIAKIKSMDDFKTEFRTINILYLVLVLILILMMIVFLVLRSRRLRAVRLSRMRTLSYLPTSISNTGAGNGNNGGNNADLIEMAEMAEAVANRAGDANEASMISRWIEDGLLANSVSRSLRERQQNRQFASTNTAVATDASVVVVPADGVAEEISEGGLFSKLVQAKVAVVIYTVIVSLSYVVGNYLINILQRKNFGTDAQFVGTSLYLLPGIIFPPLVGLIIDRTGKLRMITAIVIFVQVLSQTMFLFLDNVVAVDFWLTINSIATTSATPVLLTLVHKLLFPKPDKNYNNLMYSLSILSTLIVMLVPISESSYQPLFIVLSILAIATFVMNGFFLGLTDKFTTTPITSTASVVLSVPSIPVSKIVGSAASKPTVKPVQEVKVSSYYPVPPTIPTVPTVLVRPVYKRPTASAVSSIHFDKK